MFVAENDGKGEEGEEEARNNGQGGGGVVWT
jgi:hypothetical protein